MREELTGWQTGDIRQVQLGAKEDLGSNERERKVK
jgi:hypothetical protein